MIVAVVIFLIAGEPVATLRSREVFPDMESCAAFVEAERPAYARTIAELSARTGRQVTARTGCIAISQGVSA